MAEILIYGKPTCPHTKRALNAYPDAKFMDVLLTQENMDAMLKYSNGQRRVPIIVEEGKATIGYKGGS